MKKITYRFSHSSTDYYFDHRVADLRSIVDKKNAVIITDEHVFGLHHSRFRGWNIIVLKAGEEYKIQATVDSIVEQLIALGADRDTVLIGVGGGVVTDLTGYVASIYMRGLRFGFLPASLLAAVDASIGGKNGIDVDVYKNMVGTIRQPSFILHDAGFLDTLPPEEWKNGFAEIIKHAAILDARMFKELEENSISSYQKNTAAISALIKRNVLLKTKLVQQDEFEKGNRKLLNFGHTLGHALENQYELSHGQAISIGMGFACFLSKKKNGFSDGKRVVALLEQYGLPAYASFDKRKVFEVLKMDKKRVRREVSYVLLERIGKAVVHPVGLTEVKKILDQF
jgi:3-dehydroquinate synthase